MIVSHQGLSLHSPSMVSYLPCSYFLSASTFACLAALSRASVQREVQQKWCFFRGEISNFLLNLNSTLDFREHLRLGYVGVDPDLETSVSLP